MEKQVYKTDEFGYLIGIYVKDFDEQGNCKEELAENIITTDIPQSLYRAKWTGTEWIETMTEEEYIATLPNPPNNELTENDMIMLAIADLDAQREIDKTETQFAIAELAETLLGGI